MRSIYLYKRVFWTSIGSVESHISAKERILCLKELLWGPYLSLRDLSIGRTGAGENLLYGF